MLKFLLREKFTFLLVFLLIHTVAIPFFNHVADMEVLLDITFSAILISSILTVLRGKKSLIAMVLLVLPGLVLIWVQVFNESSEVYLANVLFQTLFNFYMVLIILLFIFKSARITRNIISAAVVAYLFVGLLFSNIYLILELLTPGSFSVAHDLILLEPSSLRYFSYVTLTTLGYGDVLPITEQAKSLAILEAFIGQIYLAVLIARLVGLQAGGQQPESPVQEPEN